MKKLVMILALVAIALGSTGCMHNRVVMSPEYDPSKEYPDHDRLTVHVLGIIPINGVVNLERECPNGAGVVENRTFFGIWGISFSQARVFCNSTSADNSEAVAPEMAALNN